jgi:hypothetical protein
MAPFEQFVSILLIDLGSFRLPVGGVGTADIGTLIPVDLAPMKGVYNILFIFGTAPLLVGIFDPEDELAFEMASKNKVEKGDVGGPYMRVACGRGGNADADGHMYT